MRAVLALALAGLALLSGCLESNVSSTDTTDDGVHSSSVACRNGDCEVCVDGTCAPCEQSECEECRDGECPAFGRAAAAAAAAGPPQDVDFQDELDLTLGLSETTYSFDVARGATGHVHLLVRDLATEQMEVMGSVCVSYEVDGPNVYNKGSQGSCSNGVGISGSTNGSPHYYVRWDDLWVGHYTITVSAEQQANELVVDIVVDNP